MSIKSTTKCFNNKLKYQRVSPHKLRRLANLIRNQQAGYSIQLLRNIHNKGSLILIKLIENTLHNAKNGSEIDNNSFIISSISIDEGKKLKKIFPRARSKMDIREKKQSHINLTLEKDT